MFLKKSRALPVYFLVTMSVYFLVTSCSYVSIDNDSAPEVQYAEGERLLKKDRFMEAIERFRILKNRYPYSKYAALASVGIGDAHYKEESFMEAAAAYKIFRELYPKHEKAGYALYRIGESHYNLIPSTIDRDLESANAAMDSYKQFLKDYPNASEKVEAEKKVREIRYKLAAKEEYVGNFYFIREQYQSAVGRYRLLVDNYSDLEFTEKSLYRLAFSYERTGEFRKVIETLERLKNDFHDGKYAKDAEKLQAKAIKGLGEEK